eukprot:COSAG02_NODE_713_length_18120_cov_27.173409_15_plen_129_part_00
MMTGFAAFRCCTPISIVFTGGGASLWRLKLTLQAQPPQTAINHHKPPSTSITPGQAWNRAGDRLIPSASDDDASGASATAGCGGGGGSGGGSDVAVVGTDGEFGDDSWATNLDADEAVGLFVNSSNES